MPNPYGICPKCKRPKKLTRHHVYPKRFFRKKRPTVLYLCRKCHDKLELQIPVYPKQERVFYLKTAIEFIGGEI